MRCASCGFENEAGAQFCEECGTPLVRTCPSCGREVRPAAKFCSQCGTTLTSQASSPAFPQPSRPPALPAAPALQLTERGTSEAERRQLTVMFCDLVGSTALSEQLDPEDLREVIRAYQETCTAVIHRFEGYVARYVGDALLVYFGYPHAHEDDAQRAVRAGLGILAALPDLNSRFQPRGGTTPAMFLQVRIGIHTGLVVVGEMGSEEYREQMALGETPNLAARLQGLAEPDTSVISRTTHQLIAGLFVCQDLGLQALKGVSAPVQVYRVLSESSAQSRLDIEASMGRLTPLVGRAHEVGLILERWTAAQAGDGQVVLLSGEPGIGKSRLVQEVKERVIQQGATCLEFRCSPYYQNSAFYPVITHLHRVLQFEGEDSPQTKLEKLQQTLRRYRFPQADTLPLLAALLSLPHPEGVLPLTLSPQKQKQRTQEALVAWLVEETDRAPVYCAWEDLHWTDPSTVELLGFLLAQVPLARLLVLLTARPEFTPPWSSAQVAPLILTRLPRTQAAELMEKVTGGKALPVEVRQQIVSKTDGVPLFVEELTKMVLESGLITVVDDHYELTGPLPPLAIPSTLQDSLMARLDRLGAVREIAQLGATIGREFSYELLQAVSLVDERTLQHGLQQLVEAELVYQRGLGSQAHYLFKHALIQDTAYQSLLKSTRQQYHRQIGQVLKDRFPETVETQPELVAHHYTEGGLIEQALPYWQQAGERSTQRSAYVEAINHLTRGLGLLKALPDTPERTQQELSLQIALGVSFRATKGFAAPEVGKAYACARELAQLTGETSQLFPILRGLWEFYEVRAEYQRALELGEQLLALAQRQPDPSLLLVAHNVLGDTLLWLGEFAVAREHLEQGKALYDAQQHRSHIFLYGYDSGMHCLSFTAIVLWYLGYPDQALKRAHEALTLVQELSHPFSLAFALFFATWLHQLRRERQATQERTEATITLSTEQEFSLLLAGGTCIRGWALAEQGQGEEGIAQIRQGMAAWRAMGAELFRPTCLALLAEAYGKVGQAEEGLNALTEALDTIHKTEERSHEAELYRLKGELTLAQSSVQGRTSNVQKEAEECFWKAIEIARKQQAKSLELRATTSLARLWQRQGKKGEAHRLLAEIYGWFTEGFDTKDLQEAKVLLEELH